MERIENTTNTIVDGVIWKGLLKFFFPIMLGTLFQQLYNTADTLIVGNFVGTNALAAVGATGPFVNLLVGLFVGLCSGAGVVIAQSWGAHDPDAVDRQVHTALVLSAAVGALLTVLGLVTAAPMMRLLGTPDEILPDAALYLRIYFLGMIPNVVYNMGTGVLRAVGDARRPLYFLLFSAGVNTGLDLLFVAVFHWGIAGAAIATVAAQVLSAGLVLGVLTRSRGCYRIQWRGMRMHRGILRNIFVVGVPSALQLAITSFSNVFVQSYVNRFASSCMAGWAAYQKIDAFVILPMTTLSVTATTFVGQNVGAGNWDRAKQGIRCALAMATVVTGVLLVPLMVFAQPLCTLFNQEPEVLGYGVYFIRLISPFYLVANFNQIYAGALRGAGDAKVPMVIMLGSFVVFRQLYLFVTYQVAGTLLPVALGYPVGWVVCSGVLLWYYRSGRWMAHSLVTPAGRGTDRERE